MKFFKFFVILFMHATNSENIYANKLSEPYKSIDVLPMQSWEGWFQNQTILLKLLNEYNPKIIVELGSWLGASTAFIAKNTSDASQIYAIDVWVETAECAKSTGLPRNELNIFFSRFYQQFLSNVIHLSLANKIIPVRMHTLEAARSLNVNPDLIYVDASHETEDVYNDIKAWYAKLAPNGIMCGDDWGWPTVREGVIKIAKELNQNINFQWNIWWFDAKK